MRIQNFASGLLRRGKAVIAGLAAATLLMPVPAMAITYLGSWQASFSQTGGPTPPKPTFSDAVSGQNDTLLVDMGEYQGATATATSTIQLTRQVSISSSSQAVQFDHSFSGLFEQAGYSVKLSVLDSKGKSLVAINVSRSTTSKTFTELQDSINALDSLAKGTYTLVVTITDQTNNKIGGWKRNTSQEHEFDFQGQ
jgi:hypothetical protein